MYSDKEGLMEKLIQTKDAWILVGLFTATAIVSLSAIWYCVTEMIAIAGW